VAGSAPFCGPNTRAAPDDQLHAGKPSASRVEAAEFFDQSPTAVGARGTAQSDDDARGARLRRRRDELADSPAVRRECCPRCRRSPQRGYSARLRAFQICGCGLEIQHPLGPHVVGQRAVHLQIPPFSQPTGQYIDEAWAAVRLRSDGELVARAHPFPARRDRGSRLDRGQAVAVAIGGDQHPQSVGVRRQTAHLSNSRTAGQTGAQAPPNPPCTAQIRREVTWPM
jgi:hypothetical protein